MIRLMHPEKYSEFFFKGPTGGLVFVPYGGLGPRFEVSSENDLKRIENSLRFLIPALWWLALATIVVVCLASYIISETRVISLLLLFGLLTAVTAWCIVRIKLITAGLVPSPYRPPLFHTLTAESNKISKFRLICFLVVSVVLALVGILVVMSPYARANFLFQFFSAFLFFLPLLMAVIMLRHKFRSVKEENSGSGSVI